MKLTTRQRQFLAAIANDRRAAADRWTADAVKAASDHRARADARAGYAHVQAGRVPCRAASWLGRPLTPADRVKVHRCYAQLEAAGLVERLDRYGNRCGGHTAYLKLTPAGEALAASLIESTPPPDVAPEPVAGSAPETKPGASPLYVSVFRKE